MKRFYTIITITLITLFAGCESESNTLTNHLTITSSNLYEAAAEGDTIAITYNISNPISGVDIETEVTDGKEAVEKVSLPTPGVILVDVKPNTTTKKRVILINVSYVEEVATIVITQAAGSGDSGNNGNEGGNDDNGDNGNDGNDGGDDNPTEGQDKEALSTLSGDHHITFPDTPRAKWIYEGDWWQTGYSNYTVMVMNKYNGYVTGDTLQLDLITDNTSNNGDFYGTYVCSYTAAKGVMMAGFSDSQLRPVGCWYFEYGAGAGGYSNYAMIIDGTATITDNGDGTSTIVLDAYDCKHNHITCNWTGVIEKD